MKRVKEELLKLIKYFGKAFFCIYSITQILLLILEQINVNQVSNAMLGNIDQYLNQYAAPGKNITYQTYKYAIESWISSYTSIYGQTVNDFTIVLIVTLMLATMIGIVFYLTQKKKSSFIIRISSIGISTIVIAGIFESIILQMIERKSKYHYAIFDEIDCCFPKYSLIPIVIVFGIILYIHCKQKKNK